MTPVEILSVQSQQANAAVAFLAQLATTGARTLRSTIQAWQTDWNNRRASVIATLREVGGDGASRLADTINRQGELAVDGYWGPNTAFTTAVMVGSSAPPTRLADVPAWWRSHGTLLATRRDAINTALATARARPTDEPHVSPPTAPPPPAVEPAHPPVPPAGQPYDVTTRQNAPAGSSTGAPGVPAAVGAAGGGLVLAGASLLGLAVYLRLKRR